MGRVSSSVIAAALALAATGPVTAATTDTGKQEFRHGVSAFRQGDYLLALSRFQAAKRAGIQDPNLDYNLGVCHYRLGHYADATHAFRAAARDPSLATLSYYNLGLVAEKQGRTASARDWYRKASHSAGNPEIQQLAAAKLAPQARRARGEAPKWFASANVALGYDDNVVDPTLQAGTTSGDGFLEASALVVGALAGTLRNGLKFTGGAFLTHYQSATSYNMSAFQLGLAGTHAFDSWRTEAGVMLDQSTLGGNDYLRGWSGRLVAGNRLDANSRVRFSYRYTYLESLSTAYDPLQGNRHQFDARLYQRAGDARFMLGYRLELNDRNDQRSGGTFTSYSATRNELRGRVGLALGSYWEAGGELRYRLSDYNDPNTLSGGRRVSRQDDRYQVRFKLGRKLDRNWKVEGEYSYTDNSSNISSYSYNQNLVTLGLSGQFY